MEFVPLLALAALVATLINFLKYVRNSDTNGALTQLSVWAAGVAAVLLVAQTDWSNALVFGEIALSDMNLASQIFLGLSVGSVGSVGHEVIKSLDDSDSASKPKLFD